MSEILSIDEAKVLLQLCKAGRLFEVQDWIESGRSLCVPDDSKTIPLEVALNTGFHSLVELLLHNEKSQELKNSALKHALPLRRLDLIELLISHGAEVRSVPFIQVLTFSTPQIIGYFLSNGADCISDSPFAVAFREKIQGALRPWRSCKRRYPELELQLQEQADQALRQSCFEGDLEWIRLLMWAGADARSSGPRLDDPDTDKSEHSTALLEAAYSEDFQVLKCLKPDPRTDDLHVLLARAARFGNVDTVRYLLDLRVNLNNKPNGGSIALDSALENFRSEAIGSRVSHAGYSGRSKASKQDLSNTLATVQLLLERGALWRPDDHRQLVDVRRSLYQCEPDVTLELVERMTKHEACGQDTILNLLRTPAIKEHLAPVSKDFFRLGFDVRTRGQIAEDERRERAHRQWKLRKLTASYDREKVYEEIWSEPILHVAKRYGMSDVGLTKVCRKLKIPRPGLGYWAKKAAGKPVPERPALPDLLTEG